MADQTQSKTLFLDQMIATARQLLLLFDQVDALNAAFSVHGFSTGMKDAFQDADLSAAHAHLTPNVIADTMFAIGTLDASATTGLRNSLRECIPGGLP